MMLGFILNGVITALGVYHYEPIFYFELDHTSHWEVEYSNGEFDWEVGDRVQIYFQPDIYHHQAENLDKYNHAYLILIRSKKKL